MSKKTDSTKKQSKLRHPVDDLEARDILRRFVIRARRVEAHSLVQNNSVEKYVKPSMTISYKEGQPTRIKYIMPDQEIFESLAARTRPCILESEPVYLEKVFRSIDMLLDGKQLTGQAKQCFDFCRKKFRDLHDKNNGESYSIQMYDKDNVPEGRPLSDLLIGEAWLYSDLVHADPKGDKARAAKLSYRDRYYAGTSFFSMLTIVIINMLNLITAINKQFQLNIDKKAWKEQVVASAEDSEVATEKMVVLPPNTRVPEGIDPSALPAAIDVTSPTEAIRFIQPEHSTDVIFLRGKELVSKVHGAFSWKNDVLSILIADALVLELSTAGASQAESLQRVETRIKHRFTADTEATNSLRAIMHKCDRLLTVIPYKKGSLLYVDCPLAVKNDKQSANNSSPQK